METKALVPDVHSVWPITCKKNVECSVVEVSETWDDGVVVPTETQIGTQDLAVIAASFAGGQGKAGVEQGPKAIIEAGLFRQLSDTLGYFVFYESCSSLSSLPNLLDDPPHRSMKSPRTVSAFTHQLALRTHDIARSGSRVLTLGGDHSIAIGTIAGIAQANRELTGQAVGVIWVDAHADINLPETSDSGNIHGMPLAFLTGLTRSDDEGVFDWIEEGQQIKTEKLVYVGLRDVDEGEKEILLREGIKAFSMRDVEKQGIAQIMRQAVAHLGPDTPIHLSFDIDALDPSFAPSTGTPVTEGLSLEEGLFIARAVAETGRLNSMDLVEVNPVLDNREGAEKTLRAACDIVEAALGTG
ncbi:MAG: hypothetical protein Q9181_006484 [Wetmoreana brouardii]